MKTILLLLLTPLLSSSALQGDWRGESVCQQKNTACRDEQVVYHVAAPDPSGKVAISADKIVNTQAVNMGTILLQFDKEKETLDGQDGPRVWHFQIRNGEITGTLTINGDLIRRISLKKG